MFDLNGGESDSGEEGVFGGSQKLKLVVFPITHFGSTIDEDILVQMLLKLFTLAAGLYRWRYNEA